MGQSCSAKNASARAVFGGLTSAEALQRLEAQGLVRGDWGVSENGRRARYYELTARGRKHLTAEASRWRAMTAAIGRVLGPALAEG